jgi:hypothetical protein
MAPLSNARGLMSEVNSEINHRVHIVADKSKVDGWEFAPEPPCGLPYLGDATSSNNFTDVIESKYWRWRFSPNNGDSECT